MEEKQFLKVLKQEGERENIPNISEKNASFLRKILFIKKAKRVLEIGTANGYSTLQFAFEIKKFNGKITTIDFSQNTLKKARKHFQESWLEYMIESIHGNALDIIPKLRGKFDFIFIDGMKKRSLDFFLLAQKKIKKWWIIIIDDVIKFKEKMQNFYDYLEKEHIDFSIIPIDDDDGIMMIINQ